MNTLRILGLDLGSASIGWAMIEEDTEQRLCRILGLGSRIIPYEGTEGKDFAKGSGESRNSKRTKARTIRKGYDRYQLRRKYLIDVLRKNDMLPDQVFLQSYSKMQLWKLRHDAVTSDISRQELGRLLLWLNQKRGYKSNRSEANKDKKETEYVATVKNRHDMIREAGLTIGQYFYQELSKDEYFRIKENIFPREAYIEEYDAICHRQKTHLQLSDELIRRIRDEIIYYQRPLKSQKGLVSVCEFEGHWIKDHKGKEQFVGPKVAPKSSPLFQMAKIWENINNIRLSDRNGHDIVLTQEEKSQIFHHLDTHEKLTEKDLLVILKKKKDECYINKQLQKGLQGNITKAALAKIIGYDSEWMKFDLEIIRDETKQAYHYDKKTGEIRGSKPVKYIRDKSVKDAPLVENQPLYRLWHTIYSINDSTQCSQVLQTNYGFDSDTADKLAAIDFNRFGFGNKSARAIRKILPYLMEGDGYSVAMCYAGYEHSQSLTTEERLRQQLQEKLKPIEKNSLRQPIVEKILNQMVNVVNALINKYGKPDEIRIELARELKQSKEEREKTEKQNNKRQKKNEEIAKELINYGLRATRNNIIKYRLYHEMDNSEEPDNKSNAICIYCGQPISWTAAINGDEVDVEHIIPKSKLFDDSQNNKTLAHRRCNRNKNDQTAYDFMEGKPTEIFEDYVSRVNKLYYEKHIINHAKWKNLLMSEKDIPDNFIDRQLRESQYIARKAREILQTICATVWCTTGSVTAELRRLWGWEDITMNLQLPKYKELELTEIIEWESDHGRQKHAKEVIKEWSKRDDHRHHAIDALTIACTKQGFIQRFNTLNATKTRDEMMKEVSNYSESFKEKLSLLEKFIISQRPISVSEVKKTVADILISFKAGKKVAVYGKRKVGKGSNKRVVQSGIIVPRGALSEQSIYGRIKAIAPKKPLKYLFEHPELICNPQIKTLIEQRIAKYKGDFKYALKSTKAEPIYFKQKNKHVLLEDASCFQEEYVIKYPIDTNFKDVKDVIDKGIRTILEKRLKKFDGKYKEAFKDVQRGNETIKWYEDEGLPHPIRTVRCRTGLSAVVPIKKDEEGEDIGFVKPGNNHHVAIYKDNEGHYQEYICTFWHAVERKKYGIPLIIKDVDAVWDKIMFAPEGTYLQSFIEQLPQSPCEFILSMQQNEMFILGLDSDEVKELIDTKNYQQISAHLYRVQKLAKMYYVFRHHLETELNDDKNALLSKRFIRTRSFDALFALNPYKVRIDCLGNIVNDYD